MSELKDYAIVFELQGLFSPDDGFDVDNRIFFQKGSGNDNALAIVRVDRSIGSQQQAYSAAEDTLYSFLALYGICTASFPMIVRVGGASDIEKTSSLGSPVSSDGARKTMIFLKVRQIFDPNQMRTVLTGVRDNFKIIETMVDTPKKSQKKPFDHLNIALRFFYLGSLNDTSEAYVDLVTCLEALFSDSNEGIGYKLANRVAILLSRTQEDLLIFETVKRAYDSRSKYVHGSLTKIESPQKGKLQQIVSRALLSSLRLAVQGLNKARINALLDESLRNPSRRRELEKRLSSFDKLEKYDPKAVANIRFEVQLLRS